MSETPEIVFVFAGEGVHAGNSDLSLVRKSPTFSQCASVLTALGYDIEEILKGGLGVHKGTESVLTTTIINVCLCDFWRSWGWSPDFVCGHSVGDLAAVYASGLWDLEKTLHAAVAIGYIAEKQTGAMLHTKIPHSKVDTFLVGSELALAAINSRVVALGEGGEQELHVTLCGPEEAIIDWLKADAQAHRMKPLHPWHHPSYEKLIAAVDRISLAGLSSSGTPSCKLISGDGVEVSGVNQQHWMKWLTKTVNFLGIVDHLTEHCSKPVVVEIGAHPVLSPMLHPLHPVVSVSSMCRDQGSVSWVLQQRSNLLQVSQQPLRKVLLESEVQIGEEKRKVLLDMPFGVQGFTSLQYPQLAEALGNFFPGLQAFDLYRHPTMEDLLNKWCGAPTSDLAPNVSTTSKHVNAAVLGVGLLLPPAISSCKEFWEFLAGKECAVRMVPGRKYFGGYLDSEVFDSVREAPGLGIERPEIPVIDPQHVLALALAARCFEDVGKDIAAEAIATPERCGIYLGAWQEGSHTADTVSSAPSAYRVLGTSLAAIASRVANTYNIQGPAMTINTACSSGLVAVHTAMGDLRQGKIDFALVGGLNLLTDQSIFPNLQRANFLSPTGRCHTFSAEADGYARSEGGVMVLLARDDGARPCRALILGSATNQNSRRRPMTAVDPIAQERVVKAACFDAGVKPSDLAVVECHGTGTKLGDPVEVSALAATVGTGRRGGSKCRLTAAKMQFGHLESGAGAVGLLKAVLAVQCRRVPACDVATHLPKVNPAVIDAMGGAALLLPTASEVQLEDDALIGVSSFGFSGNNAHVIVQAAPQDRTIPFVGLLKEKSAPVPTRVSAPVPAPLPDPTPVSAPVPAIAPTPVAGKASHQFTSAGTVEKKEPTPEKSDVRKRRRSVENIVWSACEGIVPGISEGTKGEDSILERGMDSLGLAEMITQLEDNFGEGCVSVDDVMERPTVAAIVSLLKPEAVLAESVVARVWQACEDIVAGISEGNNTEESILELGMDSLGLAEMITKLEDEFGEGCVTVDDVMDNPTVSAITLLLQTNCAHLSTSEKEPTVQSSTHAESSTNPEQSAELQQMMLGGVDVREMRQEMKQNAKLEMTDPMHDWIRTTHVGSLPRIPRATLEDIIQRQNDIGIDWINDGEWSRDNYISDVISRIENVGGTGSEATEIQTLCDMPCAADMHDVPVFNRRFSGGNGLITLNPKRTATANVACTGPVSYTNTDSLYKSLQGFLDAIGSRDKRTTFWSVPSPGTLAVFCEDRHYGNYAAFTRALSEVLASEYAAVAASGVMLQVDAPDLAMGRHTRHANLTDDEFQLVLKNNISAINTALGKIDPSRVRVHVCWGNYSGPHHKDLDASRLWSQLLNLNAKYISIEGANNRHSHDWEDFAANWASKFIESDKVLMPGVLDTRASHVEHPELVALRLFQYAKVLGPGRVVASTDCGFATTSRSAAVTEDIVWMKLAAMVEGTRLARGRLLNMGNPLPSSLALNPTGFRVVLIGDLSQNEDLKEQVGWRAWSLDAITPCFSAQQGYMKLKYAIDTPVAVVALDAKATDLFIEIQSLLAKDTNIARRPLVAFTFKPNERADTVCLGELPCNLESATAAAIKIQTRMQGCMCFDKRQLVPPKNVLSSVKPPEEADVVIVGAGLVALYNAVKLQRQGYKVAVLEQRLVVGGIWSMYANSHSQVNSSEGGYSVKNLLGQEGANRDHSTAREIMTDILALSQEVEDSIYCGVQVVRVVKMGNSYMIASQTEQHGTHITTALGVILAINDRVGIPREFHWPGQEDFLGVVARGTNDQLSDVNWQGKRVMIVGMGAFAIENVRTALEHGAEHVLVVVRRHGTVCPKMIDYLNFVKPFDENYQHDSATNIKQMRQWAALYRACGATVPECWPEDIKHEGHTISVSDLWFIGHHMRKVSTHVSTVESFDANGVMLADGTYHQVDVVIPCIGFHRNTKSCERLSGFDTIRNTNYLDKNFMYLADAEIDHGAFNWFFGSSVLEYAKYFCEVFIIGLKHEEEVGHLLWGESVPTSPIRARKWSQYIEASANLIKAAKQGINYFRDIAQNQVDERTKYFHKTLPPEVYLEANKAEWIELHTRLNGGVPVPAEKQLPYFFNEAAVWCQPKNSQK